MCYKGSKRQLVWQHNGFLGYVAMDKLHMQAIIQSQTATSAAKKIAEEIYDKLVQLADQLKERVDAHS